MTVISRIKRKDVRGTINKFHDIFLYFKEINKRKKKSFKERNIVGPTIVQQPGFQHVHPDICNGKGTMNLVTKVL